VYQFTGSVFINGNFNSNGKTMLEIFIELTNQIFWPGYAEKLAIENPAGFQMELAEFINCYNS
jgi:hypothetical protein